MTSSRLNASVGSPVWKKLPSLGTDEEMPLGLLSREFGSDSVSEDLIYGKGDGMGYNYNIVVEQGGCPHSSSVETRLGDHDSTTSLEGYSEEDFDFLSFYSSDPGDDASSYDSELGFESVDDLDKQEHRSSNSSYTKRQQQRRRRWNRQRRRDRTGGKNSHTFTSTVGAGQRRDRRSVINNRGTGSNSKQKNKSGKIDVHPKEKKRVENKASNSPPSGSSPPPRKHKPLADDDSDDEEYGPEESARIRELRRDFQFSTPDPQEMVFENVEDDGLEMECYGAPFCGLVCVDTAARNRVQIKKYIPLVNVMADIPTQVGTDEYLAAYAAERGYNLHITVGNGHHVVHHSLPGHKWIKLRFVQGVGGGVGHYRLLVPGRATASLEHFPERALNLDMRHRGAYFMTVGLVFWTGIYYGFVRCVHLALQWDLTLSTAYNTIRCSVLCCLIGHLWAWYNTYVREVLEVGDRYRNRTDADVRSVLDRRDKKNLQDNYRVIRIRRDFVLAGLSIADATEAFGELTPLCAWLTHTILHCNFRMWYCLGTRDVIISEGRFTEAYLEAQRLHNAGKDPMMCGPTVGLLRDLNSDANIPSLLTNTAWAVKQAIWANFRVNNNVAPDLVGLVQYNTPGVNAHVAGLNYVEAHQVADEIVTGGDQSKVLRVKTKNFYKEPENKIVGVAPIGVIETSDGPVMMGHTPITSASSLIAAFCGRILSGMTAPLVDSTPDSDIDHASIDLKERAKFLKFSERFLQKYVDETDVSGLVEPDAKEYFAKTYQGKKPVRWIDKVLKEYDAHLAGTARKKFYQNGAFVKREASVKVVDGVPELRPRLICTMSDLMLVRCTPVLEIIHAWNRGPFKRWQVKDMGPEEMIAKIAKASRMPHMVTDYSRYEAAIDAEVRARLEHMVLKKLLLKAGFIQTLEAYTEYNPRTRTIHCEAGVFRLSCRDSGGHGTSMGNGITSVCIMAYCADKQGLDIEDFEFIAEGDDGLIDKRIPLKETIKSLGFGFSTELEGNRPGDVDFLRSRWIGDKRYLNIGRVMPRLLWVKKGCHLKRSKQLFLLRAAARSIHQLAPGHPVLCELINLIGRKTSGISRFASADQFVDQWKKVEVEFDSFPRDIKPDETMRAAIAAGAEGFPPISISNQLLLEARLRAGELYVGSIFSLDSEVTDCLLPKDYNIADKSSSMEALMDILERTIASR